MNDETNYYQWLKQFRFLVTPEHPCNYIEDKNATTLFVDPQGPINVTNYTHLTKIGFRRSGEHIYRPHCSSCNQCKLVRILVDEFNPGRNDRRRIRKNADLTVNWQDAEFSGEHFDLYKKYMQSRHAGSSMDSDDPAQYIHILKTDWCNTKVGEFRLNGQLIAVAITDWLDDGLSAVYTYFDPDFEDRSPGRYAILQQVEAARLSGLRYLYLGYWIKDCK